MFILAIWRYINIIASIFSFKKIYYFVPYIITIIII